jgi:hypothetical protein
MVALTRNEVLRLKLHQRYRNTTPTFFALRPRLRWFLGLLGIAAPFALLENIPGGTGKLTWWLFGFFVGAMYVKGGAIVSTIWTWWLTREITDWKRVDQLISEYESAAIQPKD